MGVGMSTVADGDRESVDGIDARTPLIRDHLVPAVQHASAAEATARVAVLGEAGPLLPESRITLVALQNWKDPPINRYRYFVTLFSFVIMGMSDGVVGVGHCLSSYANQPRR